MTRPESVQYSITSPNDSPETLLADSTWVGHHHAQNVVVTHVLALASKL